MPKAPKPTKLKDLRAGIPYFTVWIPFHGGTLHLGEVVVFRGRPFGVNLSSGKTLFIKIKDKPEGFDDISLRDHGIELRPDDHDNYHRTFRFNQKDYNFMKDIVDRQDYSVYMNLIGKDSKK